ncbi:hypoxanthine phosphoribosyltransferase [Oscillospiraceae bacterium HV4-5-C5C]|nr:hypoxanthine phosphoribosyltransferase [Oscillospiraceae bacterium HV4-5-C5C]
MAKVVESVLIGRKDIDLMCRRVAGDISRDYAGKEILIVGVLKGAFIFLADLVRYITVPVKVDFIAVSSYGNDTKSSGVVRINKDLDEDITGCHVIVVEDIIDTGLTLLKLKNLLQTRGPASLKICTAFDKPSRRTVNLEPDYCGQVVPDRFVVGYGLDFNRSYRNLPDLCVLADEEDSDE